MESVSEKTDSINPKKICEWTGERMEEWKGGRMEG